MNLRSDDETVDACEFIEPFDMPDCAFDMLDCELVAWLDFAAPAASCVCVCAHTAAAKQNDTTPMIWAGAETRWLDKRFLLCTGEQDCAPHAAARLGARRFVLRARMRNNLQ
jgi:hypothetical protein